MAEVSNPYKNLTYKRSVWDVMLNSFGLRSQEDAWRENMQVQANEWDSAYAMKLRDEQYNSPSAQAARMRAAGLNPDLSGNITPGEASSLPQDPSTPMQTVDDGAQIKSVVSGIIQCFSTALGMVSTFSGVHKTALENRLLGFQTDKAVADYGIDLAPTFVSPISEGTDMSIDEILEGSFEKAKLFSKRNLPKRYREQFNNSVWNFLSSAPGEAKAYEDWYNDVVSQKKYHKEANTFYSPSPKVMTKIYSILGDVEERLFNLSKVAEGAELGEKTAEADFNAELYDSLDPKSEASARNAEAGARKNQAEVTNILRGAVNDILKALKSDDSEFSGIFGFLLRLYSLYMFTR